MKRARLVLVPLAVVGALALGGCSSDDEATPRTTSEPGAGNEPAPREVPSQTQTPSPSPSTDADEQDGVDADELPPASGLVLAAELDTNAPVDPTSLGGRVTPSQVQAMRRAWNERQLTLEAAAAKATECVGVDAGVWVYAAEVAGGTQVLALGTAPEGQKASCSLDEALVVVDASTSEVLGDDAVALLL